MVASPWQPQQNRAVCMSQQNTHETIGVIIGAITEPLVFVGPDFNPWNQQKPWAW